MDIELVPVDPDDAEAVGVAADLGAAVDAADAPAAWPGTTAYQLAGELRHGWDGDPPRMFLASAAGVPVARGAIETSSWDNADLAWLRVEVHPDHRRRGHGTELLAALTDLALAEGRPSLGLDGWAGPAPRGFAARAGFTLRTVDAVRQHVVSAPGAREAAVDLAEEAARVAAAYELVRFAGPVPEEMVEELAQITAAINDAPTDDLDIEDEVFTAERVRRYEEAATATHRMYRLVARHRGTGALAGHSVVAVETDRPQHGWQHDTSVVPAHRGHRLGLLLKAAMVGWLAECEPALDVVTTFNAASNDPMIAVNEALGYELIGQVEQYQLRVVSGTGSGG